MPEPLDPYRGLTKAETIRRDPGVLERLAALVQSWGYPQNVEIPGIGPEPMGVMGGPQNALMALAGSVAPRAQAFFSRLSSSPRLGAMGGNSNPESLFNIPPIEPNALGRINLSSQRSIIGAQTGMREIPSTLRNKRFELGESPMQPVLDASMYTNVPTFWGPARDAQGKVELLSELARKATESGSRIRVALADAAEGSRRPINDRIEFFEVDPKGGFSQIDPNTFWGNIGINSPAVRGMTRN